jgi:hypothetical protein
MSPSPEPLVEIERERIMKKVIVSTLALLALALFVCTAATAAPYSAPPLQPQATAEAAAATVKTASAIESAAWGQATAEAARVTAQAQAEATAEAQAMATAAAVTAQARDFQTQLTRQAADLEITRAVYELDVTRAAIANAQQAEALALERERTLRPLKLYGPWAVFFLFLALVVWGARRLAPAVEGYLESQAKGGGENGDPDDAPGQGEERVFVVASPLDWAAGPSGEYGPFYSSGVPQEDVVNHYVIRGN